MIILLSECEERFEPLDSFCHYFHFPFVEGPFQSSNRLSNSRTTRLPVRTMDEYEQNREMRQVKGSTKTGIQAFRFRSPPCKS